jgi:hypothetical protein
MTQAGYSGTPLPRKLGLKDGMVVAFAGLPPEHHGLTQARDFLSVEIEDDWRMLAGDHFDYVHLFTDSAEVLREALKSLRAIIKPAGMIWVSWPKKASKVPTDVTEDVIRNTALSDVLVDVKVCAVDEIWSGLKLVIRKEARG